MFCKISEKNSVKNKKNKNYLQQKRKKGIEWGLSGIITNLLI